MDLRRSERGVLRVGHRGAAALAAENSLEAIEAAAAHRVDAVELDVLRAPGGALVLAHGPELTSGAATLDDGLALASRLGLAVQLDVKAAGVERDAVDALRRHGLHRPVLRELLLAAGPRRLRGGRAGGAAGVHVSQDRLGVSASRLLRPAVKGGLAAFRALLPRRLPGWLRRADAAAATLNWTVVSPATVAACHRAGAAVLVWTVNDAQMARTLVEMGADGIISDDPGILLSW